MIDEFNYRNIERIVYIWGRYAGTRDATKEGKHYTGYDIKELIRRLERFIKEPKSFQDGFEKEDTEEQAKVKENKGNGV